MMERDGCVDGRARLGVERCGRGYGWKMEGSETGCVDGGVDGTGTGARLGVDGCGLVGNRGRRGCRWR